MKKLLLILLIGSCSLTIKAQSCPPEWSYICSGGYLYNLQCATNDKDIEEAAFKEELTNIAMSNLARQIEVKIQDYAQMKKTVVDGDVRKEYRSSTSFSTDIALELLNTRCTYNSLLKEGCAIAYIDKSTAQQYYKNKLMLIVNDIESQINIANNYSQMGYKKRASEELEATLSQFKKCDTPLYWLNVYEHPVNEIEKEKKRINDLEARVKKEILSLTHATAIYIKCNSDLMGQKYNKLVNEIKGKLSLQECNFVEDATLADWVIEIDCQAREYNTVSAGQFTSYYTYVDAHYIVKKQATNQCICEDEIAIKGGHTTGYIEAGKEAYKELSKKLSDLLAEYINE